MRFKRRVNLSLRPAPARGFEDWLVENLAHVIGVLPAQNAKGANEKGILSPSSLQL